MEFIFQIIVGVLIAVIGGLLGYTFKKLSEDTSANNAERIANGQYRKFMTDKMDNVENKVDVILTQQREDRVEHAKIDLRLDDHHSRIEKLEANQERRKS